MGSACFGIALSQAGTYDVPVNWDAGQQRLVHSKKNQLIMEDPDENYWDLQDYMIEFGDPLTNGLGHKKTTITDSGNRTVDVVHIPSKKFTNSNVGGLFSGAKDSLAQTSRCFPGLLPKNP